MLDAIYPSLNDCLEICKKCESFLHKIDNIDGYTVHQFNYRLASFSDFFENDSWELRGICFVERGDGTVDRFLALNKFFSLNQCGGDGNGNASWMYDDVKDKKIIRIQDKLDGSLISFIRLPNGRVLAKSKFSFDSDQAKAAQQIYENNPDIRYMVDSSLDTGFSVIFELVGPFNRIVVGYPETELRVIQIRNQETGEYLNLDNCTFQDWNVKFTESIPLMYSLDDLVSKCETETGYEGFVIQFDDGQLCKLKTKWYLSLHHLLTESINRPDYIVEAVLEETIDDAIAQIPPENVELRQYIEMVSKGVSKYFNESVSFVEKRLAEFDPNDKDSRKAFAIKWKNHPMFAATMQAAMVNMGVEKSVKLYIMKQCNGLKASDNFLKNVLKVEKPQIQSGMWQNFTETE